MSGINRREFIRRVLTVSTAGAALTVTGCGSRRLPPTTGVSTAVPSVAATVASPTGVPTQEAPTAASVRTQPSPTTTPVPAAMPDLVVARGGDPAEITRRAVAALGGIERFVKPGANVIIKPNMCVGYSGPEYASTTNPQVVGALVALCLAAGAKRVRVMDLTYGGTQQDAHSKSGIGEAVTAAGGQMEVMSELKYRQVEVPQGKVIKKHTFYGDILDADVLINVPIAKTISSVGLTLGMKNMMGVVLDRSTMHSLGLPQSIADINTVVKAHLTIMDAVRILTGNGPTGGSLNDVKKLDTVIASKDVIAADAYAATLFGMSGKDIPYTRLGAEMGLGEMDLDKVRIEQL